MNWDTLQKEFYETFEGLTKVPNPHINCDHSADQTEVFRSLKKASHQEHAMKILPAVRTYQQIKESRRVAKLKGVTTDDTN